MSRRERFNEGFNKLRTDEEAAPSGQREFVLGEMHDDHDDHDNAA